MEHYEYMDTILSEYREWLETEEAYNSGAWPDEFYPFREDRGWKAPVQKKKKLSYLWD